MFHQIPHPYIKPHFRYSLCVFLFTGSILVTLPGFAQQAKKKDLEVRKKEMQSELEYQNKILKETTTSKQLTLSQLIIINKNISIREQIIAAINSQIIQLNRKVRETSSLIESMGNDLNTLKSEYAKLAQHAYKNRDSYDRLVFIFSAHDFNQAFHRLKYYEQFTGFRRNQATIIQKIQQSLNSKVAELEQQKKEKEQLLSNERSQKQLLSEDKEQQQNTIKELQHKEKQLKEDIKNKQKEIEKLQKAIEEAIRKEMEEARKKGMFALTPEMKELSSNFENNRSKLPWPVEKGVITELFGEHDHSVIKSVRVKNNGIEINTTAGSTSRAVFEGEVSKVITIPNSGKAVLVRHGEFLTVYFKLNEVFVAPGDKVKLKQELGSIITDESTGKTELHFEIWKGKTILNPSEWLFKANP